MDHIIFDKNIIINIFNKHNFMYNISKENINLIEIFKIPNINILIIKNIIKLCKNNKLLKKNIKDVYSDILKNFINSNKENIIYYTDYIKIFIKFIDNDEIKNLNREINNKTKTFMDNKKIFSSLKFLNIYINKFLLSKNINIEIDLQIEEIINLINNANNIKKIIFYSNKILNYLEKYKNIDYNNIINNYEKLLNNNILKDSNIIFILDIINKCKKNINNPTNILEKILFIIDNNIYNYVYFLNNNENLISEKTKAIEFISKIEFSVKNFKEIDSLNLKRGFIQGLTKDNKDYLLKFQPNKSVMELLLNCYLKNKYHNFLIPEYFFINSDNSYFYIIEKYKTDLYKYFNILEAKNKILYFDNIIHIIKFIINSIKILHNNNVIHSDLKLENIVLNYNHKFNITDLKIIDFDVGLFNIVPKSLDFVQDPYKKILNNRKPRGTRIYMIKEKEMDYTNDIYSLGVISLILLYKNTKLILSYNKKNTKDNKKILKYNNLLKKLNKHRDNIEDYDTKIKMLNLIISFFKNEKNIDFIEKKNIIKLNYYKEFIINCLKTEHDIENLFKTYSNKLFFLD